VIRLFVVMTVALIVAAGGAMATQSLLKGTPGGVSLYQYGAR
jgi:hypothetical protein